MLMMSKPYISRSINIQIYIMQQTRGILGKKGFWWIHLLGHLHPGNFFGIKVQKLSNMVDIKKITLIECQINLSLNS